jgi:N-acetylneuraminic acid mutarotase
VIAAPSAPLGSSRIVVFGGDDGALAARVAELGDRHPGFSRDVLAYDIAANTWTSIGTMPRSLVTTTAVPVGDAIVIAGGEDRPGHRSAAVLRGRLAQTGAASTDEP